MSVRTSIDIAASPDDVWAVLSDIQRWPEWTGSVASVTPLDSEPLHVGARARVKQPRMPTLVWEVTELTPARSFTWVARPSGVVATAEHLLSPTGTGSTQVELSVTQTGPLAGLAGLFGDRMGRRYVEMEAQGLKRRCEDRPG